MHFYNGFEIGMKFCFLCYLFDWKFFFNLAFLKLWSLRKKMYTIVNVSLISFLHPSQGLGSSFSLYPDADSDSLNDADPDPQNCLLVVKRPDKTSIIVQLWRGGGWDVLQLLLDGHEGRTVWRHSRRRQPHVRTLQVQSVDILSHSTWHPFVIVVVFLSFYLSFFVHLSLSSSLF